MRSTKSEYRKLERNAKIQMWLAGRASRNRTPIDWIARWMLHKFLAVDPQNDFMRDPMIDNDTGFDPDELDRYQRGKSM